VVLNVSLIANKCAVGDSWLSSVFKPLGQELSNCLLVSNYVNSAFKLFDSLLELCLDLGLRLPIEALTPAMIESVEFCKSRAA